jgi:hypothetical protein
MTLVTGGVLVKGQILVMTKSTMFIATSSFGMVVVIE